MTDAEVMTTAIVAMLYFKGDFRYAIRKIVETTGSLIERLLPKSIYAVTVKGFELKVALFVLASSINFLW